MSLGIFSQRNKFAKPLIDMRGLGASYIPGGCWDQPGFKDCHATQYRTAQIGCETNKGDYPSVEACIENWTDKLSFEKCVPQYCPKQAQVQNLPKAEVERLQAKINENLTRTGYYPIEVDGSIGPLTCGAMKEMDRVAGTSFLGTYGANCTKFTMPLKKGAVVVQPSPTTTPTPSPTPTTTPTPTPAKTTGISKAAMVTGAVVVVGGIGAYLYSKSQGMTANKRRRR